MASLLTDEMLEGIGSERVDGVAHTLAARQGTEGGRVLDEGVACRFCEHMAEQFFQLTSCGIPVPSVIAGIAIGSLRLGWGLAYDQIEQDVALVNAVTGDEG